MEKRKEKKGKNDTIEKSLTSKTVEQIIFDDGVYLSKQKTPSVTHYNENTPEPQTYLQLCPVTCCILC